MNNISVVKRLFLLVTIPILVIVFLVASSLFSFGKINDGVGRMYDDNLIPLAYLKLINDSYTKIINAVNKADNGLLDPNDALAEINESQSQISEKWAQYKNINHPDAVNELIRDIDGLFADADVVIRELSSILKSLGRDMEYDEDGETVITDYNGDLFEYIDPIAIQVEALIDLQTSAANAERSNAQSIYDSALKTYLTLSTLALFIMISFGYYVGKSISGPLKNICNTVEYSVKNRDLSVTLPKLQDDEIGKVGLAFEHIINQFNGLVTDVTKASDTLAQLAKQLTASSDSANSALSFQSNETQHVVSVSDQLSHASEGISNNAAKAAESVNAVNNDSGEASRNVTKAVSLVGSVKEKIDAASDIVERVAKDSIDIGDVLNVIRGIADQTNLLALNAAIEAARAGEQGRGFAVVADEVRSLAQRTQESTQTIQSSIEKLQSSASDAVKSMIEGRDEVQLAINQAKQAGEAIHSIASTIAIIQEMNKQNADSTVSQMDSSKEISNNLVNISDATAKTTATMGDVNSVSQRVSETASQLSSHVTQFKV